MEKESAYGNKVYAKHPFDKCYLGTVGPLPPLTTGNRYSNIVFPRGYNKCTCSAY